MLNGSNLSAVSAYETDSADDEGWAGSSYPLKAAKRRQIPGLSGTGRASSEGYPPGSTLSKP